MQPTSYTFAPRRPKPASSSKSQERPSGQDGQDSAVQVLGWAGNEFGEMRALPAKQMYLVR